MGEYVEAAVFKPAKQRSASGNRFDKLIWELYEANGDQQKIEAIYRNINFVHPNGAVLDLNMRFINRNGQLFRTNRGILGVPQLPDLSLVYKYHFHDFWMAVLMPSEMRMDDNGQIRAELRGSDIYSRMRDIERNNKDREKLQKTDVFEHFMLEQNGYPKLKDFIGLEDIVQITAGHIFDAPGDDYRKAAREKITAQRKRIAEQLYIPHWRRTDETNPRE